MTAFLLACVHLDPFAIVKAGGYLGLGVLIFAESGLFIGIFLPGDSLLFAAGLLAGAGLFSPSALVVVVVVSAILGDTVGYWFGKKIGNGLETREDSRFFKQIYLARTRGFYEKYGGRAVVLARFIPVVRTMAPILAGAGRMPYTRFLSYNALGALLWGAGVVLAGYTLGIALPGSEHYVLPLSLAIVVVSFIPMFVHFARGKNAF